MKVESDADDGSKDDVDGDLKNEVTGDAPAGVAHGLRHAGEVAIAGETDETVAEVFALEENKEGEYDSEERSGERLDDAAQLIEAPGGAADFADLDGVVGGGADGICVALAGGREGTGGVGDAEFFADVLDFVLGAAVGGVARTVESLHFLRDVVAVDWGGRWRWRRVG